MGEYQCPCLVERLSPTDVMELVCDVTGTSMQVAAVLILGPAAAVDLLSLQRRFADRMVSVLWP